MLRLFHSYRRQETFSLGIVENKQKLQYGITEIIGVKNVFNFCKDLKNKRFYVQDRMKRTNRKVKRITDSRKQITDNR